MAQRTAQTSARTAAANTDAVASAKLAGLRYVTDAKPGIRRVRRGTGFAYVHPDGSRVHDRAEIARIRSLVIPPAWTEVWICSDPNGHMQVTGRDARRRKQYRYHPRWRDVRDATKYGHTVAFAHALPHLRERTERDLALPGLPRAKVLATVVRLLETTHIRIGNEEYAKANGSVGLTTMRDRHVDVAGSTMRFEFSGKSGRKHRIEVHDRRLARIVKRCQDIPGYELFQYIDDEGARQTIDSADVNTYLREITGEDFTAKDFRTWAGTVLAACALAACGPPSNPAEAKRNVTHAIADVAQTLGNTPAVCRACYVHPAITEAYREGVVCTPRLRARSRRTTSRHALDPREAAVLSLLSDRAASEPKR